MEVYSMDTRVLLDGHEGPLPPLRPILTELKSLLTRKVDETAWCKPQNLTDLRKVEWASRITTQAEIRIFVGIRVSSWVESKS